MSDALLPCLSASSPPWAAASPFYSSPPELRAELSARVDRREVASVSWQVTQKPETRCVSAKGIFEFCDIFWVITCDPYHQEDAEQNDISGEEMCEECFPMAGKSSHELPADLNCFSGGRDREGRACEQEKCLFPCGPGHPAFLELRAWPSLFRGLSQAM